MQARAVSTAQQLDRAHAVAAKFLDDQRAAVAAKIAGIEKQLAANPSADVAYDLTAKLRRHKIELGLSDPENHLRFNDNNIDYANDVFIAMEERRWNLFTKPKLLKSADHWEVRKDALPADFVPSANVQVNFNGSKWLTAYGQHIDPAQGILAPSVTITRPSNVNTTEYFTLMMTDLDRPNIETGTYEEWCHWLITDIPVAQRAEITGGASPFFHPDRMHNVDPASPFASLTGLPTGPSAVPGNVVLDYIPPHPAFSNPRRVHRYLFTLFKQPTDKLKMSLGSVRAAAQRQRNKAAAEQAAEAAAEAAAPEASHKPGAKLGTAARRAFEGEGEMAIALRERFLVGPAMLLAKTHQLELAGFGFVTAGWKPETSHVFSALGIHEPVFGKPFKILNNELALRLDAAAQMVGASQATPTQLQQLAHGDLARLNQGRRPSFRPNRLISTGDAQLEAIRRIDTERAAAGEASGPAGKAAKADKKADKRADRKAAAPIASPVTLATRKTPRLTEFAAAAIVRNKPSDVASSQMGEVTAAIKTRRSRYENV
ncbi:39S ribosomal protein L38, mitochondrial [Polyrhizophydium stewartii]|uniref:39S ribosomal protein L38, mitochondrial n=1 Tax=Polyrhizophydium stewartii TaxID=2732419 RepID=A0ABR4MX00_9FUNG|nr:hypothetical protein HK105_000580 [Polyrhizophydium stewartii]